MRAAGVAHRHRRRSTSAAPATCATARCSPTPTLEELRGFDAILLGAVGTPEVPPGVLERGLLLQDALRARPLRQPAARSYGDGVDFVVIRENTEGTYAGEGGFLRKGTPHEVATQGSVNTRIGVERCVRYAFELAQSRPRKHLTLVHKTNVLTFAGDLWQRTFDERGAPSTPTSPRPTTTSTRRASTSCRTRGATTSSSPTTCSATSSPTSAARCPAASGWRRRPTSTRPAPARRCSSRCTARRPTSSAPGKANPIAAILSAALMLDFLGEADAAARIRKACADVTPPARRTVDRRPPSQKGSEAAMPITPTEKIWMNGELVDWDDAQIHVLTHTLHYGTGVFEGIRAYETPDGPGHLPAHRPHRAPLQLGQDHDDGHARTPSTSWSQATKDTVRSTGLPSCYVRPIAYYGYGEMGLNTLPCTVDVAIACWPWGAYLGEEAVRKGVRMKISSWTRHDHNTMPPASKTDRQLRELVAGQGRGAQGRLRRGHHAQPAGLRDRVHRREHLRRPPRHAPHAAAVGRRARGHHAELGDDDRPRPRLRRARRQPRPQRPVHRRGDLRVRHRRRGHAGELGRRPRGARAPAR